MEVLKQRMNRDLNIANYLKQEPIDSEVSTEPTTEVKKRWFYWSKLVSEGRKHSYQGLPDRVLVRVEMGGEELIPVFDYSKQVGAAKKIAKRRAKNRVAKAQRKVNR